MSEKVAISICNDILAGKAPVESVINALKDIREISSTCIEDIGRQILKISRAEECIRTMESAKVSTDIDRIALLVIFSILFTYYRRLRIEDKMEDIVNKFRDLIGDSPVYIHAKAMWIEKSDVAPFNSRLLLSLKYEMEALMKDPDYVGAQHKLADLVVQALEEGWQVGDCTEPDIGCIPKQLVLISKNYLRRLAYELNYPRAYYTLARFNILERKYDKAVDLLGHAIRLEPAASRDYSLRLAEYYNTLFLARSLKRIELKLHEITESFKNDLEVTVLKFSEQLKAYESRILTLISVYIAIITIIFTFTTISSSPQLRFIEALILEIIIIMSIIILIIYLNKTYLKPKEKL